MRYELRKLNPKDRTRCEACKKRTARILVTWYGQWAVTMKRCVKCTVFYIEAEVSNSVGRIMEQKRRNKMFVVNMETVQE